MTAASPPTYVDNDLDEPAPDARARPLFYNLPGIRSCGLLDTPLPPTSLPLPAPRPALAAFETPSDTHLAPNAVHPSYTSTSSSTLGLDLGWFSTEPKQSTYAPDDRPAYDHLALPLWSTAHPPHFHYRHDDAPFEPTRSISIYHRPLHQPTRAAPTTPADPTGSRTPPPPPSFWQAQPPSIEDLYGWHKKRDPFPGAQPQRAGSRLLLACANCRLSKRKCDGLVPCVQCMKRKFPDGCYYQVSPKRRGKKPGRQLKQEVQRMEHQPGSMDGLAGFDAGFPPGTHTNGCSPGFICTGDGHKARRLSAPEAARAQLEKDAAARLEPVHLVHRLPTPDLAIHRPFPVPGHVGVSHDLHFAPASADVSSWQPSVLWNAGQQQQQQRQGRQPGEDLAAPDQFVPMGFAGVLGS